MTKKAKKSKSGLGFIFAIVVIILVWFFASPFVFLYNLRQDAIKGKTAELSEKVDFPAVREDIKTQVAKSFGEKSRNSNDPFSGLANALAPKIAERLIDSIVTPEGIANAVKSGKLGEKGKNDPKKPVQIPSIAMNWKNPNNVTIDIKTKAEGKTSKIGIRLARKNVISWKLVGLELPIDDLVK